MKFEPGAGIVGKLVDVGKPLNEERFLLHPRAAAGESVEHVPVNPGDFDQNLQRLNYLRRVETDYRAYIEVLREWQQRVSFDEVRDEETLLSQRVEAVLEEMIGKLGKIALTQQGTPAALKADLLRLIRRGSLEQEIVKYEELAQQTHEQVVFQEEVVYGRVAAPSRLPRENDPEATGAQDLKWNQG